MEEKQISLLERLKRLPTGERAALRRMAGRRIGEADGRALQAFYNARPHDLPGEYEEQCFSVLCMACLWREDEVRFRRPFIQALRQMDSKEVTQSLQNRVRSLLDLHWQDGEELLIGKLARLARMLRADSASVAPNFELLLNDLIHWDDESRWIQRNWARDSFFRPKEEDDKKQEEDQYAD